MKFTIKNLKKIVFGYILVFSNGLYAVDSAPADYDTLATLLKELREIRQARYELQNQWKDEKEQLELIKNLEGEKLEILKEEEKVAKKTLSELKNSLSDTKKQNQVVNESASHLRDWIDGSCKSLLTEASRYSILMDEDRKKGIHNILKKDTTMTDKIVLYLNLLLDTAISGIKANVGRQILNLDGDNYSTDVLTLGGTLKYFVTADNKLCGFGEGNTSDNSWKKLDQKYAESIRTAIRVVNSELPPKLVSVPVPPSVIKRNPE